MGINRWDIQVINGDIVKIMEEKWDALKQKIKQEKEETTTISIPLLKQMANTKKLMDILQNYILNI